MEQNGGTLQSNSPDKVFQELEAKMPDNRSLLPGQLEPTQQALGTALLEVFDCLGEGGHTYERGEGGEEKMGKTYGTTV